MINGIKISDDENPFEMDYIKQLNSFVIPPHFQHNRICKTSIMMRKNNDNK
jgi:hypothetical protein